MDIRLPIDAVRSFTPSCIAKVHDAPASDRPLVTCSRRTLSSFQHFIHFFAPFAIFFCHWRMLPIERACLAGATASQWVVVVNGSSDRSRTIANYYANWRDIPAINVIVLDDVPTQNTIPVGDFRDKILQPILYEIEHRKLASHIQGIAYSSDFPTAIDLSSELTPNPNRSQYLTPIASINGLTYLFRFVMTKQTDNCLTFVNNFYVRRPGDSLFVFQASNENEATLLKELGKAKEEKEYEVAAKILDKYFTLHPHQFPVAYATAQMWAMAGQSTKGLDWLQKAIELGWSFSEHTKNDPQLVSLKDQRRFQALVRSCEEDPFQWTPAAGFDARRFYSPNGVVSYDSKFGVSYMLSMVLAVCSEIGNTEQEALAQLKQSILADYTHPKGVFYITDTSDVRTKCRKAGFQLALDQLKGLNQNAEILPTILPISKPDVLGITMGTDVFAWGPSESKFVPGAIADNLTSFGGAMEIGAQTKLTEFLRYGAAAASGAVTEPYSMQVKFPHPTIHASYASGLTCAEAFYSSLAGPYQLLIVGDPLCQPFAYPPKFFVEGFRQEHSVQSFGLLRIKPSQEQGTLIPLTISLLFDGVLKGKTAVNAKISLNDPRMPLGSHQLRLIGESDTRKEERWEQSYNLVNGSSDQQLEMNLEPSWNPSENLPLRFSTKFKNTKATISIRHDSETVFTLENGDTRGELPTEKLGRGPVRLQAVAKFDGQEVLSIPVTVWIDTRDSK